MEKAQGGFRFNLLLRPSLPGDAPATSQHVGKPFFQGLTMQFLRSLLDQSQFSDPPFHDTEARELYPGVVLERRTVLGSGLATLIALSALPGTAQETKEGTKIDSRQDRMDLESLIASLRPVARRLVASDRPDEEHYLQIAIEHLSRVSELETNRFVPAHRPGWELDLQAYVPPLLLYQIRMAPNSVIDLHDHRHHNGVLCVREGSARVRSFDLVQPDGEAKWDPVAGQLPSLDEEFMIQEKGESILKPGQTAGLTRSRENIHQIEAGPAGCLLHDLFTNFRMNAQSFEIKWDGKYWDAAKKLCKVTWIAPDHTHE